MRRIQLNRKMIKLANKTEDLHPDIKTLKTKRKIKLRRAERAMLYFDQFVPPFNIF